MSLILITAVTLAGCGGDDDDDTASGDGDVSATTAPSETSGDEETDDAEESDDAEDDVDLADCPLTAEDVSGVFGIEMIAIDQARVGSGCGFESAQDPISGPSAFYRLQSPLALESFGPEGGGEEVSGLGDEAVYLEEFSGSAVVRVGDVFFEIQVIPSRDADPRESALALAEIVVASI